MLGSLIAMGLTVGAVLTLLWFDGLRRRRAAALIADLGDDDIPVQIKTYNQEGHGETWTSVRYELDRPWDDLRCELGGVERAGWKTFEDPREVQALHVYANRQPLLEAFEDPYLRQAVRVLLLDGGVIDGGVVWIRKPGRPVAIDLATMQSQVVEVVRRLQWATPKSD